MPFINQSEFASLCGVSRKTVTKWKQAGKLKMSDGRVDVDASLVSLAPRKERVSLPAVTSMSPDDAQLYAKASLAMLRGKRRHEQSPGMIERSQAAEFIAQENRFICSAFRTFPARVGPLIAAKIGAQPDDIVKILKDHIDREIAQVGTPDLSLLSPMK